MSNSKNKFYVTTPIYYVTAKPHLGHLYSNVLADVLARWAKVQGKKTFFLTGTDEHGQKIEQAAAKAGKQPKTFVDSFISAYKDLWREYEIEYDYFIRTTDDYHIKAIQQWLQDLLDKGDIYKSYYRGWYCTSDEAFVAEVEKEEEQAPLCPTCNRTTILISEESYFFKLSAYQDKLLQFYEQNPDFFIPKERGHEVVNFVKSGLRDLSISRTTVKWGVPFPNDSAHVAYVWADALNNYITAIGYGQPQKQQNFAYWWPADVQVIGKDIIRFHAVYWPAFLMASDLALPKHLLVHGWIKVGEHKMSKSLGNVIDPQQLYQTYGADPMRYYLTRYLPINQDAEFSIADLEQKIASDLANDLGNLLNRMTSLAEKHGVFEVQHPAIWSEASLQLRDATWDMLEEYSEFMEDCVFHMAYAATWKCIAHINAYFHAQEPWKLAENDRQHFMEVLSATCHALRAIAAVVWPVMPQKIELLLESIGGKLSLHDAQNDSWAATFKLQKIPTLFVKPEVKPVEEKIVAGVEQLGSFIDINDFAKIELVVGTIKECEEVPKSDKLFKLQVDFGDKGMRQILAGIKQSFTAEDLLGKQGVFVFNLAPRKMLGLESQGMMLVAPDANGKLQRVTIAKDVPNGTKLR